MATLAVTKATHFAEYTYEIEANWKITYDNFQENYHLRHVHGLTGVATVHPDNLYGYPDEYTFDGPNRTQQIWTNPEPLIRPMQGYNMGLSVQLAMQEGIMGGDFDRTYFAIFPSLFVIGNPIQHFSHKVYPISATRSRGVFRIYWVGADDSATRRYAREYALTMIHDIHTEDVNIIDRAQKGLLSGAIKNIHFMNMEGLCRHLYLNVVRQVEEWQAEQAAQANKAGEQAC